jgi:hypothetical protein
MGPAIFLRVVGPIFLMAFTYQFGANPPIDYPRLLISDTVQNDPNGNRIYAFEDSEIMAAQAIEQNVWMSPQYYSGTMGQAAEANPPVSYRRVAATLLDSLAANQARLSIISGILDVKLNAQAAKQMQAQAAYLRRVEDESGAFVIIEQVNDEWSFIDRYWKTIQRQSASTY